MGIRRPKKLFISEFFFLSKREMTLEVVTFSWLFYSIFRWGYILNETLWLALSVLKFIAIYLQCLSFEKTAQGQQWGTTDNGITPCKGHTTCNFHKQKSTISRWVYGKWPLWSNSTKQYFFGWNKMCLTWKVYCWMNFHQTHNQNNYERNFSWRCMNQNIFHVWLLP